MGVLEDSPVTGRRLSEPDLDKEPYIPGDIARVYGGRRSGPDGYFEPPRYGVFPSESLGD